MQTDNKLNYLMKAVAAFRRRMLVVSPDFRILAAGRPEEGIGDDVVGRHCHQVFYGRDNPCEACAVESVLAQGRPALVPKPSTQLDLSAMPCYYAYPIYEDGEITAAVSLDFDIPTRQGIEERLQHSNAMLRNFICSAIDCVIAADKTGRILIFNTSATELFGYSEEEALTRLNIRDIYPDGLARRIMADLRSPDHGGRGRVEGYITEVVDRDGERIPIRINAAIVYENGKEVATVGYFHDMRETLRMEADLKKTQGQLIQAEKMSSLGKLAAGVAHQLNNPLGGIILYAKLLLEEYDLPDGAGEDVERILQDAERCRDTVRELLEFTRQTRNLMRRHDLNAAVSRTLFLLENQTLFHNIEIRRDLDENLPAVNADIQQLNHLLMNLILNAVQAMEGRGTLTIRTEQTDAGDRVRLTVADSGPGIPEDVLPDIFAPFYTTKEEGKGTGLGLSLAYNIVENHGGTIKAESLPGEGATFLVELPIPTTEAEEGDNRDH